MDDTDACLRAVFSRRGFVGLRLGLGDPATWSMKVGLTKLESMSTRW